MASRTVRIRSGPNSAAEDSPSSSRAVRTTLLMHRCPASLYRGGSSTTNRRKISFSVVIDFAADCFGRRADSRFRLSSIALSTRPYARRRYQPAPTQRTCHRLCRCPIAGLVDEELWTQRLRPRPFFDTSEFWFPLEPIREVVKPSLRTSQGQKPILLNYLRLNANNCPQ